MNEINDFHRLIASELTAMESLAQKTLANVDPFVGDVVRYCIRFGGKRLRPILLFLVGKAVGIVSDKHIQTAAAIEFVHTASLIHDDILDGASIRRHLETVNVRWSSQVGVLAGDLLLTKAMELMAQNDELHGFRRLTDACQRTCEGELRQIGTIGHFDMTPNDYFEMIAGKTAPLLACSAELGAYYAGADVAVLECFQRFGHKLGLAFQITDDILDLVGETMTTGKTLRTDLLNRKPTLPLILYLQNADLSERAATLDQMNRNDFNETAAREIVVRFCESGTVDATKREANRLIEEAVASLSIFPVKTEAVAALISIARFVTKRET
jgi:octaprenyl-diphosphate synthase